MNVHESIWIAWVVGGDSEVFPEYPKGICVGAREVLRTIGIFDSSAVLRFMVRRGLPLCDFPRELLVLYNDPGGCWQRVAKTRREPSTPR